MRERDIGCRLPLETCIFSPQLSVFWQLAMSLHVNGAGGALVELEEMFAGPAKTVAGVRQQLPPLVEICARLSGGCYQRSDVRHGSKL